MNAEQRPIHMSIEVLLLQWFIYWCHVFDDIETFQGNEQASHSVTCVVELVKRSIISDVMLFSIFVVTHLVLRVRPKRLRIRKKLIRAIRLPRVIVDPVFLSERPYIIHLFNTEYR